LCSSAVLVTRPWARRTADKLSALRGEGEVYSDVIIRLAAEGD
jgi:hypothetical protein